MQNLSSTPQLFSTYFLHAYKKHNKKKIKVVHSPSLTIFYQCSLLHSLSGNFLRLLLVVASQSPLCDSLDCLIVSLLLILPLSISLSFCCLYYSVIPFTQTVVPSCLLVSRTTVGLKMGPISNLYFNQRSFIEFFNFILQLVCQ